MAKTAAQLDREVARLIAGDAELEGRASEAIKIRKQGKVPRIGVRGGPLLGYTASGKPVHAPTRRGAPDTNNIDTFIKTKAKFPGWTKADHMDASNLFDLAYVASEHDENDFSGMANTLKRWRSVHWDIGGRWNADEYANRFGHGIATSRDLATGRR